MDTLPGLLAVVFLAVLASHSGEATSDCYVKLVPASNTLFLHRNDDVSIVCDASCFGRRNQGRVTWYGPGGNPVPRSRSGRMFQMIYNRNMFSRLFLFGIREEDSGTYTCSVGEGDDVKMATIFLDISDGFIRPGDWGLDSGRGRGDVSILVPTLPPLSPLRRRRALPRVQRDTDGGSGDSEPEGPQGVSSPPPAPPRPRSASHPQKTGRKTERKRTTKQTKHLQARWLPSLLRHRSLPTAEARGQRKGRTEGEKKMSRIKAAMKNLQTNERMKHSDSS